MSEDDTIRRTGVNPAGHTLRLNQEAVPGADPAAAATINAQVEAAIADARETGHATINDGFANWGGQVTMDDASVTGPGATVNIDSPEPEAEP
jgi:hypothetical protein